MPKLNTTVKAVRVDNDVLERFEKKLKGQSVNSWLNEQILMFVDGDSAAFSQNNESKTGKPLSDSAELEEMALCFGMTGEEMLHSLVESLNEGLVTVDKGKVVGYLPWADEFEEVCHDLCIDVEKAASGAIKALRNGR